MPNTKKYQCLAVYLYYNEPWETFLSEAVLPYVKTTLQTGIAAHYFFIRYWDRGPHLRLRFFGDAAILQNVLRPNLEEHFQTYFKSKPSERKEPPYSEEVPEYIRWIPNNSLAIAAYEPEVDRYGGRVGVEIAEKQFYASSQVVLENIVAKETEWTYEDALGIAIKLHLTLAYGMQMSLKEAQSFFHFFFHNWLPRSIQHLNDREEDIQMQLSQNLDAFEKSFQAQKEMLIPFHQQLWRALELKKDFAEKGLNEWLTANKEVHQQLLQAQEGGVLLNRSIAFSYSFWPESVAVNAMHKERWMHCADYMHMTNNRLGILNQDEGYLGFLMMKSMGFV